LLTLRPEREHSTAVLGASRAGGSDVQAHYQRLTALDASFLEIEDASTHMHVAATLLFEPGPLATADGGLDVERLRAYVASRLQHIPRYRQRLHYIPYEQHPVWVDDERFNLFYHVRHTSLPRPGSERQLKRLCGRILSQKLDPTKPLWEIWVVEGLEGGRFAMVAKVHHCMVDGISGVDLLTVLLSPTPETDFTPAAPWKPRPAPSSGRLVADELLRRVAMPFDLARAAARAVTDPGHAIETAIETAAGLVSVLGETVTPASETPLNPERIGPHRRFDWLRMDLSEVKAVKQRLGGTVNDVVLATVVGALRRFLPARGVAVEDLDFRALIPVSVRARNERCALGNKVAQMMARLPLDERDPYRRLQRVTETTTQLKQSHQVEASELIEELSDWAASGLMTQVMRLGSQRRLFNLIVTNVPGPPVPLYLLGAPLLAPYPSVPLFTNQALGIALFSYADGLYWGVSADWDVVPDLHEFVEALDAGFRELVEAQ
jgi:diacylglycerol O-acyltransferase